MNICWKNWTKSLQSGEGRGEALERVCRGTVNISKTISFYAKTMCFTVTFLEKNRSAILFFSFCFQPEPLKCTFVLLLGFTDIDCVIIKEKKRVKIIDFL